MFYRIKNDFSHRHIDENGYLYVDKSPILKSGILEYYGSELLDGENEGQIDGVKIEPDKIYKVFIPPEELEKAKDSFALKPLVNGHEWLGREGKDAKDFQEGTTGETAEIEGEFLYVPLMFSGKGIIDAIENEGIEELSASYENKLTRSDNEDAYDFVASDLKGNHVAVVERGRCGSSVRVLNKEKNKMKTKNEVKLVIDGKEIDLGEFFAQEATEDAHAGTDAITENEDKREIIREIMAVAGKSDDEFEGGEDEKVREVAKLAEKLAYNPSEETKSDNEDLEDKEEKEDLPDEVKEENKCKARNYDAMYQKIFNAVAKKQKEAEESRVRAYNAAKDVCGDFNFTGMSERDIYVKALNHLGVPTDQESVSELSAMLKACKKTVRVDNAFSYGISGEDTQEVEPNF